MNGGSRSRLSTTEGPPQVETGVGPGVTAGSWVCFGLVWLLLLLVSLADPQPPLGSERPSRLDVAAGSLRFDADLLWQPEDRRRLEDWPLTSPSLSSSPDRGNIARAPWVSVLVAPWVGFSSLKAPIVGAWLALLLASWLAIRVLVVRLGRSAPAVVALLVLASALSVRVGAASASVFTSAFVVAAFALALGWRRNWANEMEDLYSGETGLEEDAGSYFWPRFIAVGAFLGAAAVEDPLFAFLTLPLAFAAPMGRRLLAGVAVMAASLAVVVAIGLFAPWALWNGVVVGSSASWSEIADLWLVGWNLVYWLGGQHVGVVVTAPLVALLWWCRGRGSFERWLQASVALICILSVVLRPYDFPGSEVGLGNSLLLPLYGALWFLPERSLPKSIFGLLTALALFLSLPWWGPPVSGVTEWKGWNTAYSRSVGSLPVEATLAELPCAQSGAAADFWLRWSDCEQDPAKPSVVNGHGELLVASRRKLTKLYLRFGRTAPSELEVVGATVEGTIFRPDGSIDFEVALGRPRSVPVGWAPGGDRLYNLTLRMPAADGPESFTVVDAGEGWRSEVGR